MGCNDSRLMKFEVEETILGPFEDSLGYKSLNSIELDNTFHRYSRQGFMTIKHLNQALTVSKLPYSKFSKFYELFELSHSENVCEKLYSTDLLKTLSLMLSKATNEQKILILFKNYDIEASKEIDKKIVLIMVYNIFFVALKIIPNYCKKKNRNNNLLEEYIMKLEKNQKNIMTQIYRELTKGHSPLKFQNFRKNCLNSSIKNLFSVNLLRKSIAEFDRFSKKNDDLSKNFDEFEEEENIDIDVLLDEVLMKKKEKIKKTNSVGQYKISFVKSLVEKSIDGNDNAKKIERNSKKVDTSEEKEEERSLLKPVDPLDENIISEIEEIYSRALATSPDPPSTDKHSGKVSQFKDKLAKSDPLKLKKHAENIGSNEKKAHRKNK